MDSCQISMFHENVIFSLKMPIVRKVLEIHTVDTNVSATKLTLRKPCPDFTCTVEILQLVYPLGGHGPTLLQALNSHLSI